MKKLIVLLVVMLVVNVSMGVFEVPKDWTTTTVWQCDDPMNNNWTNPANWSDGVPEDGDIFPLLGVDWGHDGVPALVDSVVSGGGCMKVGIGGPAEIIVENGGAIMMPNASVSYGFEMGQGGDTTVTVRNGGLIKTYNDYGGFTVGWGSGYTSVLNVEEGGHVDAQGWLVFPQTGGGSGTINLAGEMDAGWLYVDNPAESHLNISGSGILRIHSAGDLTELTQSYIDMGSWVGIGNDIITYYDGEKQIVTLIPEPMTISLLGVGALALIRRKRA